MRSHCGAARVAYNWCLAQVKANWAQRAAEQTYGLTGDQLTPWINTSAYSLRKAWNAAKSTVAPWWAENSKEAYASGCANLSTALGNRRGGRARMPRFKSKRRARLSCRFTTAIVRTRPGPPSRPAPRHRGDPHVRVHPQARPQGRGRDRAHPLGHPVAPAWAVARRVLRRARRARADRAGRGPGRRRGPGHHRPRDAVHRRARAQPAAAGQELRNLRRVQRQLRPAPRPGPAHPVRAVEPMAQGPRPRRRHPHPGGEPAPQRHPPAHHPPGPRPRRRS